MRNKVNILLRVFLIPLILETLTVFMAFPGFEHTIHSGYLFRNITMENGLSNNKVNAVCRDQVGFMWFGTNEGLNRYDGYNMQVYKHDPSDSSSLCDNLVRCLFVDKSQRLWIATDNGLDVWEHKTETFHHVCTGNNTRLTGIAWKLLALDEDNMLLAATSGLYFINTSSLMAEKANQRVHIPENAAILSLYLDSLQNLYIGTFEEGLYIHNLKSKLTTRFAYSPGNKKSLSGNRVECISQDKDGNIWIGTNENGLNFFNASDSSFEWIDLDRNRNFQIRIRDIVSDRFGRLWVGTYKGLYLKEPGTHRFLLYAHHKEGISSILNNSIYDIHIDAFDMMWLGTYSGGVNYCDFNQKKFKHYTSRENDNRFLNDPNVFAIAIDSKQNICAGTERGGLNRFDGETGLCSYITAENHLGFYRGNNIKALCFDEDENLWIGTYQGGLNFYHTKLKKFINYRNDPDDKNSLISNTIYSVVTDNEKNLWIGTLKGVCKLPYKSTRFIDYTYHTDENAGLGKNRIFTIYKDTLGNLWVGSEKKGLYQYDRLKDSFIKYKKSFEDVMVTSVFIDRNGHIWTGSNDGLRCYNPGQDTLIHYTEKAGLPTSIVSSIVADNEGNLWVSTANGLVKFVNGIISPEVADFKIFNTLKGLKVLQFANNSLSRSASGELFFGGVNGFISFNPHDIKDNPHLPDVKIIGLKIANNNIVPGQKIKNHTIISQPIYITQNIRLSHKHYIVTFEFSAMHYSQPGGNRYAYMLEGFDEDWNYTSSENRFATYTSLPGKEYVFKVKAVNCDNNWSKTPATLFLKVVPPVWQTWWFRILLFILAFALVLLFYRLRIYNIRQQKSNLEKKVIERTRELSEVNALLEEKQEEIVIQNEELARHRYNLEQLVEERTAELEKARRKAEESDRLKSAFLANMSHEIRTPMNAIVGFSNLLLSESNEDEKREYVNIITNNSETLIVLINDILDISMIEADQLHMNPQRFDANPVLQEFANTYRYKNKAGIEIILDSFPAPNLVLFTDQFRFRQILNNLLGNALKYTDQGYIRFGYNITGGFATFYVSDTGVGIDKKDYEKVFNYFQKLDNKDAKLYRGAGIGLSICKKLLKIMGGRIWLESEPGQGTTFFFTLPCYSGSENNNDKQISVKRTTHPGEFSDCSIIIAEDEPENYTLLERIITSLKANILWMKTGKEVLDYVQQNAVLKNTVILMDIKMSVMNGMQALTEIRKINQTVPVIAITAYATENERNAIIDKGFDHYISKPFSNDYLSKIVIECLQRSKNK
ncbi:MAG: response regulator [Bacteroidales bacterium]|nr:response regulator [Bacteroidales bacterium]